MIDKTYQKYREKGPLIWVKEDNGKRELVDHLGNTVDPKSMSSTEYKARKIGPLAPGTKRRTFPDFYYKAEYEHKMIKMVRNCIKNMVSSCSFHDVNLEDLFKKIDMRGNPEPWEKDVILKSASILKALGKEQPYNIEMFLSHIEQLENGKELMETIREEKKILDKKYKKEVTEKCGQKNNLKSSNNSRQREK